MATRGDWNLGPAHRLFYINDRSDSIRRRRTRFDYINWRRNHLLRIEHCGDGIKISRQGMPLRSMTTTHKASLRHAAGLVVIIALLAGMLLSISFTKGLAYSGAMFGLMTLVTWRFSRMRLIFTDDKFIYCGWLKRYEFPYSNIARVSRPADEGWPKDRIYGRSVFEVTSKTCRARINLLWFGASGSRAFRDQFITHTKKRS